MSFLSKTRIAGLEGESYSLGSLGTKIVSQRDFNLQGLSGTSINKTEQSLACLGDATVNQAFDRLTEAMFKLNFRIESDSKEAKELLEQELLGPKKTTILKSLALAKITGIALGEVVWSFKDGIVSIRDFFPVDSSRVHYVLTESGHYKAQLSHNYPLKYEDVPDNKFVIHRHYQAMIDNPYGLGVGGLLIELIEWKNTLLDLWFTISKRNVEPIKIGSIPESASEEDADMFYECLVKLKNSSTFVLPQGFSLELQDPSPNGLESIVIALLNYCDEKINGLILGESIVGKDISNANQHRDGIAAEITEAKAFSLAQGICDTLNETLVKWLVDFNFKATAKIYVASYEDLDLELERLTKLKQLGLLLDQDWLAEKFDVKITKKKTLGTL
jgi:hypothetical protein